ncbi:hypothetical protein ACN9MJ_13145 [Acidovorax facilis]|uniref:hypothetical protein n=1 Tax=Acidovorax facilis TaxID=12917 RepID=UPI003CEC4BA2
MAFALTTLVLGGCANQTSIWRSEDGRDRVLAMDAQQRVVISSVESIVTDRIDKAADGGTTTSKISKITPRYCPEPSPDAIASFASSLAAGLSIGPKSGSLEHAISSSVSAVGLRTPTTQVIRDLITAACIADINGAFDSEHYRDAFARNQQFVLAAHAIAVLGGEPVVVPGTTSSRASQGSAAEAVTEMYAGYQQAVAARQKADAAASSAKAAADAASGEKKAANDALEAKKKEAGAKPEDIKALESVLDTKVKVETAKKAEADKAKASLADAMEVEAAASKAVTVVTTNTPMVTESSATPSTVAFRIQNGPSDKAVEAIQSITEGLLSSGFTLDKCLDQIVSVAKSNDPQLKTPEARAKLMNLIDGLCQATIQAKKEIQTERLRLQSEKSISRR